MWRKRGQNKLVRRDGKQPITEKSLTKERKDLEDTYLNHLKGFGSVILCTNKAEFKAGVARLEARVAAFKNQVEEWAGSVIERNRASHRESSLRRKPLEPLLDKGRRGKESNQARQGSLAHNGFEDRGSHQAHITLPS